MKVRECISTLLFHTKAWSKFHFKGCSDKQHYISFLFFLTFAVYWMLYAFFWVIPRRLNFICRRFGTLSVPSLYLPAYEDGTECSEKSVYKIQTPGNYPEENTQHYISCLYKILYVDVSEHCLPHMKKKQTVPKRHIKFRRRGITQKKAHNIIFHVDVKFWEILLSSKGTLGLLGEIFSHQGW